MEVVGLERFDDDSTVAVHDPLRLAGCARGVQNPERMVEFDLLVEWDGGLII